MLRRIVALILVAFSVFTAISSRALAADCIIVGAESSYRIPDCIENFPITAIQKILESNYAIITDRKDGKIFAVFLAEHGSKPEIVSVAKDNEENQDFSEIPSPSGEIERLKSIAFPRPISISDAESALNDLKSDGQIPARFILAAGDYLMAYDLADGETISDVFEREKPNLLDLLDQQQNAVFEHSSLEFTQKSLQMIEQGRNALLNGDVSLTAIEILQ